MIIDSKIIMTLPILPSSVSRQKFVWERCYLRRYLYNTNLRSLDQSKLWDVALVIYYHLLYTSVIASASYLWITLYSEEQLKNCSSQQQLED